jgi:enterobacterial common antigen flippase
LIVTPGLILTLTFSPWIVQFFYAKEFLPAVELLQWFVIAGMASVLSRPTGQIMIALGKSNLFLLITIALQGIYILFLIWALAIYGLLGSAMAWVLLRLIHVLIMMFFARNLISFSMPNETEKLVIRCALPVVVLFIISSILPSWLVACIGSALLVFSCRYNLLSLRDRLGREHRIVSSLSKIVILRTLLK